MKKATKNGLKNGLKNATCNLRTATSLRISINLFLHVILAVMLFVAAPAEIHPISPFAAPRETFLIPLALFVSKRGGFLLDYFPKGRERKLAH